MFGRVAPPTRIDAYWSPSQSTDTANREGGIQVAQTDAPTPSSKSRIVAALLALFLGTLGIHQFYLGNTLSGVIRIVVTLTYVGAFVTAVLALVECVMYLVASDEKFNEDYVVQKKAFPWSTPSERVVKEKTETSSNRRVLMVIGAVVGAVLIMFVGCIALIGDDLNRIDRINDQMDRALDQNDRAMDQLDRMLEE